MSSAVSSPTSTAASLLAGPPHAIIPTRTNRSTKRPHEPAGMLRRGRSSPASRGLMPDAPTPASDSNVPPKRRWLRPTLITAQVLMGLGLGLAVAELAFAHRDDGAFPHVNFYLADPELGVRLEPGARMRFRLHDNPVSEINVNRQGYRGADWPDDPAEGEILIVGDSQVFGLGVNDDQTFAAGLAEHTGRPVLNA